MAFSVLGQTEIPIHRMGEYFEQKENVHQKMEILRKQREEARVARSKKNIQLRKGIRPDAPNLTGREVLPKKGRSRREEMEGSVEKTKKDGHHFLVSVLVFVALAGVVWGGRRLMPPE